MNAPQYGRPTALTTRMTKHLDPICISPGCANPAPFMNTLCVGHATDHRAKAERILTECLRQHARTLNEIRGTLKLREYVLCRMEIVVRLRAETLLSWYEIGEMIGRTHCSAIYLWHKATKTPSDPQRKGINLVREIEIV